MVEKGLLMLALLCIPAMLLVKPVYLKFKFRKIENEEVANSNDEEVKVGSKSYLAHSTFQKSIFFFNFFDVGAYFYLFYYEPINICILKYIEKEVPFCYVIIIPGSRLISPDFLYDATFFLKKKLPNFSISVSGHLILTGHYIANCPS